MGMPPGHRQAGFTIVELLAILMILGILSGVAAPRVIQRYEDAALGATASHLKTIALAAETLHSDTGAWPSDAAAGVMPSELSGYLRPNLFAVDCPVGGQYEWDTNVDSVAARVKIVHDVDVRARWLQIDAMIDDGSLTTGRLTADFVRGRDELFWLIHP